MNEEEANQFVTFLLEWIESPTTSLWEKRAFFEAYDKAGNSIDTDCMNIFQASLERQAQEVKKSEEENTEFKENKRLLENAIAREEACVPGSISLGILNQAGQDMDKIVQEFEKELDRIEANTKNQKSDNK